jgi:REP element-mobilizing transposase RayT
MKYNPQIHHRRSIRLQDYDYSSEGAYFVTMCTQNRECLFGEIVNGQMILNGHGKIVEQCWNDLPNHYDNIELDAYVIMPDHFHGIIFIVSVNSVNSVDSVNAVDSVDSVDSVAVGAIHEMARQRLQQQQQQQQQQRRKMLLPKIVGRFKMNSAKQINQMRNTPGISVWQRNYYEHIIRNDKSLENIRNYIINNPVQWYNDNNA